MLPAPPVKAKVEIRIWRRPWPAAAIAYIKKEARNLGRKVLVEGLVDTGA